MKYEFDSDELNKAIGAFEDGHSVGIRAFVRALDSLVKGEKNLNPSEPIVRRWMSGGGMNLSYFPYVCWLLDWPVPGCFKQTE